MAELFPIVSLRAFDSASRADRAVMAAEVDRICRETGLLRARRQSFACFHQPNWFAEIVSLIRGAMPKYEPALSGPYLMGKFKSTVRA